MRGRMNLVLVLFIGFSLVINCTGTRPDDIGIRENGSLKPCPLTPNCVTSLCDPSDEYHYMDAFSYTGSSADAMKQLKEIILKQERSEIIIEKPNYIYAEFTTKIMRFVDDVEFLLDEKNKKIHLRSASRIGRKDFGVNRDRF